MQLLSNRETDPIIANVENVVGRVTDKNTIIRMLFDPKYIEEQIAVFSIVGFGGLGKTTLAQLVYNDEDVKNHFDVAAWACVPETGDENIVMRRVYESLTDSDKSDDDRNSSKLTMGHENTVMRLQNGSLTGDKSNNKNSSQLKMGEIKSGIIKLIRNKKYLLILDDIWDEKHKTWTELLDLLKYCARGSKVIVTTRSKKVANALGTKESHTLGLLTKDESRILFKKIAFKTKEDESNSTLTELGEEIVESCGNVPLAIKVIGCLLYDDNSEEHWKGIRDARLSANVKEDKDITQVLKLSYDYLSPALKQCFAYCALFPKDHRYSKERLVKMWMAQGYINPSRIDIGEKYFMGLLGRSLFQDPEEDDEGKVAYCKMHDLVHDLAQDIAGEEIVHDIPQDIAGEEMEQLGESNQVVGDRLLHAGLKMKSKEQDDREVEWEAPESLLDAGLMRSLILHSNIPAAWKIKASSLKMILKFKSLRVLEFSCIRNSTIPNSIGKLRHLRYLDLTNNDIGCLPDGITRLPKEMPPKWLDGLSKLVVIRLTNCRECTDLPHLSQLPHLKHLYLISLSALEYVVEGGKCSSGSHNLYFPSLEVLELHHLDNLKGWARPTTDEPRQLLFPCLLLFQFDVNASSTKAGVIRGDRIQLEGI
ncbi:putative disease resistance protein RGA3 [Chenopodium quinoa]|uniref:putative disease resistance protein RGA3 n=1 Tax=Chenopodium quinoa TaxID=63459 RepID=UPI000B785AE7|nr:putative disease resistance protein RGA3 [Chenopodium quinoa]XP_021735739.1 putative disease resistance protein RGA3 [Chenopodium quinoa]XP_021735742.1 putative disease resistance protein RGA3 [Chenopodium quinoa]